MMELAKRFVEAVERIAHALEATAVGREFVACTETVTMPVEVKNEGDIQENTQNASEGAEISREELIKKLTAAGVEIPPRTRTNTLIKMLKELVVIDVSSYGVSAGERALINESVAGPTKEPVVESDITKKMEEAEVTVEDLGKTPEDIFGAEIVTEVTTGVEEVKITFDELFAKLKSLNNKKGSLDPVRAVMREFDAETIKAIKETDYAAVVTRVDEEIAKNE